MEPTRRGVLLGGAGSIVLACGLGGSEGEVPAGLDAPPAPPASPAPFRVDGSVARPQVRWDDAPAWFRDAPALWCPSTRTAGSVLLTFTPRGRSPEDLCERLTSFRDLPALLARGRADLGCDVLYLTDWYQGAEGAECHEYWRNKARYLPREDLGGEAALVEGTRAVKAAGGRVILYVEPFVLEKSTDLGRERGEAWALKRTDGHPDQPYPSSWKICPSAPGWQEHVVEVASRVVGRYGASGVFLDSYGNQRGWRCVDPAHGHPPNDGGAFDEGCRALARAVREAARRADPEAVVMVEGSKMPAMATWVAGSLDWGVHELSRRWSWREAGHTGIFTAGWSLDDAHQILAMGHRLALGGDFWTTRPVGSCAAAVLAARAGLGAPREDRMRRYAAEVLFRLLHQWRNAGLLAGRPVPDLEAVTPRRWDLDARFATPEAYQALLDDCEGAAAALDGALAGAPLAAAGEHLRGVLAGRARFSAVLRGAEVEALPPPGPTAAAYRVTGPGGVGVTAVNVGDAPVSVTVPVPDGAYTEQSGGGTLRASGGLRFEVAPHRVVFFARS